MNRAAPFTPTLRQLRAFHSVFQLGKLSAAAERMAVTQSAVSVLIRQMEQGLGVRLFDRTTRSLQPTAAAREAAVAAERILRDVDSLGAGLRDVTALRRGRVAVAVTPTLGEILLPRVIERFAREHPEIRLVVDDCAPDQFVSRVLGEHVDLGIGTPERAAADVDTQTLLRDHLAVVCRRDHPFARQASVRWRALAGHPVIAVRPGYGIRPLIDGAAAQAGVQLDVVNEVTFLSTAVWLAACGQGLAIMPSAYARHADDRTLAVLPLAAPRITRNVSIVTRRGRSLSPAAQRFIAVTREVLGAPAR